ncbi:hypothetical protein N8T08_004412 [Aspergillus melleus]|uniref:Uncharacterized protein n=1 Tax=Aspergillus melleus TaxID=138277 RepID=A0ACC3B4W6_9EURO|nr:hypothetical protein N8T08_004412 [Aspergillus melleus]
MGFHALPVDEEFIRVLAKQSGRVVLEFDFSIVKKIGSTVLLPEAEAMRLLAEHTSIPSPTLISARFGPKEGCITMDRVEGSTLEDKWDTLDETSKESICHQTWDIVSKIRAIPRPPNLEGLFLCLADGSPSKDEMFKDLQEPDRPLRSDSEVRARIFERYYEHNGRLYANELPDMLPRAESSVFTHGDIAPRNIMVDDQNMITGLIDWEWAGWYPDYWEYAQILRPAFWGDWSEWMARTAQKKWDIMGINVARKFLINT